MNSTKTEQKRTDILEYASLRFGKYGVAKTTIDELARDMRMGKASLYHYFSSKEDLYYQAIEFEAERFLKKIIEVFNKDELSLKDKLVIYYNEKSGIRKTHRILFNLFSLIIRDDANLKEKEAAMKLIEKESSLVKSVLSAHHPADSAIEDRNLGNFFAVLGFGALFPLEILNILGDEKKKESYGANFSVLIEKALKQD
ncbi:MAG: TetR/AcrR family transcriptional regulator [Ignavibacteriaceae bacterium]|nr:TetR/AcrR family transcriptional regulator [Ignavibacteriaceae bacterium]